MPSASTGSAEPLPSSIPVRREEPEGTPTIAAAVLLVLVLIAAVALQRHWLRQRKAPPAARAQTTHGGTLRRLFAPVLAAPEFSVRSSRRLTPRASLHLVEWRGRQLLLGCTDAGIAVLDRQPAPASAPDALPDSPPDSPEPAKP
ncbi:hypothetical protein GT347_14935 [Xylophilus rhododendri]|uniref:Flagellar biosynthesis protein FliO n=1 Tax=Xylophilus rhododendri TaxID=2697032 RepID=A0A857J614_9BURK|nr:flagellar biosynthetic protein FliO [Xylophilus rhododendri]QHI99157.1 hypothetical protein GT347_14935 [Xylophilus rhododendri]